MRNYSILITMILIWLVFTDMLYLVFVLTFSQEARDFHYNYLHWLIQHYFYALHLINAHCFLLRPIINV